MRRELRLVKAQLAEAKITIADLKQGSGCGDRIGTSVAPTKHSVAVQAKPPVECESRIPRPEETTAPGKLSAAGMATARRLNASQVSTSDVSLGSPAAPAGSTAPVTSAPSARSMARSRIPASPSPDAAAMRRSTSARQPASTLAAATEDAACGPSSNTSSEAGACAEAGALAEASSQARADLLANQLKVAEAFRQSLETELRDLRFKNAGLQTQVLTLQTKLERAVESQVDELDRMQKLRKAAGGTPDSRGYEEVLAQMAVLERKLEVAEAAKTGGVGGVVHAWLKQGVMVHAWMVVAPVRTAAGRAVWCWWQAFMRTDGCMCVHCLVSDTCTNRLHPTLVSDALPPGLPVVRCAQLLSSRPRPRQSATARHRRHSQLPKLRLPACGQSWVQHRPGCWS